MNHDHQLAVTAGGSGLQALRIVRGVGLAFACSLAAIALWTCVAYGIFAAPVIGWLLAYGIVRLYALGARSLTAGGIVFALVLIAATVVAATVVGLGKVLIFRAAELAGLDPWALLVNPVIWQTGVFPVMHLGEMAIVATVLTLGIFAALGAAQSIHWYRKAARVRQHPLVYGPMTTADMLTIAEFGDPEHRAQLAQRRKLPAAVIQVLESHAPQETSN